MKDITVIIPAYNSAAFIGRALESVLAQSLQPSHILIIDDCSTDNTFEIAQIYASKHPQIKLVRQPKNLGPYPNLNAAIKLTTTEFISKLDADDYLYPQALEKAFQILNNQQDVAIVFGKFRFINELGNLLEKDIQYPEFVADKTFDCVNFVQSGLQKWGNSFFYPSYSQLFQAQLLYRKSVVEECGFFPEWFSESDIAMWFKIGCHHKIHCINEPLYDYRQVTTSVTHTTHNQGKDLFYKELLNKDILSYYLQNQKISNQHYKNQLSLMRKEYLSHLAYKYRTNGVYMKAIFFYMRKYLNL